LKRLLLFDIDGTLVDTAGVGLLALRGAMLAAFPDLVREESLPELDLRGATDAGVIRLLFATCGVPHDDVLRSRFVTAYLAHLERGLASPPGPGVPRALPGVTGLLRDLARSPDRYALGLLTGNLEQGAYSKLRHFGLAGFFPFGAFGLDRENREELGPVALERAWRFTGQRFTPEETVVIGDTPRDIACARAFGARCLAVATGGVSADEMAAHRPDALLRDLTDQVAFRTAVG